MRQMLEQLVFEFQPMLAERLLHASFRHVFLQIGLLKADMQKNFIAVQELSG